MQNRFRESAHDKKNISVQQVVMFLIIVQLPANTVGCIHYVKRCVEFSYSSVLGMN